MVISAADRCPGALHIVAARDGGLARIRIPGGIVSAVQFYALGAIAQQWGDGYLDITARANIQIRGIQPEYEADFSAEVQRIGLLPAPSHDRVRNILCSPFAGIDPAELVDVRPIAAALDAAIIAGEWCTRIPAKFSFALDGGGIGVDLRHSHIGLRALQTQAGLHFHLFLNGSATGYGITLQQRSSSDFDISTAIVDHLLTLAQKIHQNKGSAVDIHDLNDWEQCATPQETPKPATFLPGQYPGKYSETLHIVPLIPLGRLNSEQVIGIAALSQKHLAEIRLTPWPGLILASVARSQADVIEARLQVLGLHCRADSGYVGLHACAGLACSATQDDVRARAASLSMRLDGVKKTASWRVNIAGCAKQCAMRGTDAITLTAAKDGYMISHNGAHSGEPYTVNAALDYVVERAYEQSGSCG